MIAQHGNGCRWPAVSVNGGRSRLIQRHMDRASRCARVRPYEQRKKYEKEQTASELKMVEPRMLPTSQCDSRAPFGHQVSDGRAVGRQQQHALHACDDAVAHGGTERQYRT